MYINKKHLCFALFITFLSGWASVQAQTRGYIVLGDTTYTDGYVKFDNRNPLQIEFQNTKKSPVTIYKATELTEFGYSDSTKFASRVVNYGGEQRAVFMELLTGGELNLYMLRGNDGKQYFFEKEHLNHLTKENLLQNLEQHAGHSRSWQRQLPLVRLTKPSLTYYTRNINKNRNAKMPLLSYGASLGFNLSTIQLESVAYPENEIGRYSMTSENIDAGMFVEAPISAINNLHLLGQLSYGKMQFASSHSKPDLDQDVKMGFEFLRLSALPKYHLYTGKISFYVEAGVELIYLHEQSSQLLQAWHEGNKTTVSESEAFFHMATTSFGMNAGAGLQFYYLPRHYVSFSLNNGHVFGPTYSINNLSTTVRINL